jgi:hypothetical protein
VIEGVGVTNDSGVGQAAEEDNHPELPFLPFLDRWESLPHLPDGASREVDPRFQKDTPDESRTVIAKIIGAPQKIG